MTKHSEPSGVESTGDLQLSDRMQFHGHVPDADEIVHLGAELSLVSDRKGDLTHAVCNKILLLPEFVVRDALVDRNLRDRHVEYLTGCMMRGTFHPEWVQIVTCVCGEPVQFGDKPTDAHPAGTEFRMNGQHTCWARLNVDEGYPCKVRFLVYAADTVAAMRQLYASIDRNAARTTGNVLDSYLAGTEQFVNVPRRTLRAVAGGLSVWLWIDSTHKQDADLVARYVLNEYRELADRVTAYLMKSPRGEAQGDVMTRSAVVAALYETMSVVSDVEACTFWDAVRDGIGMTTLTDPRKKLHDYLRNSSIASSGQSKRSHAKKFVSTEEMYRACVHCWNVWRKGKEIKNLKVPMGGDRPKAV